MKSVSLSIFRMQLPDDKSTQETLILLKFVLFANPGCLIRG